MKKQLLFLSLAAVALLVGCTKNENGTSGRGPLATEISAKAFSRGSIDTKAPVAGNSLNGLQADVYCNVGPWTDYSATDTFIKNIYAYGTMTFDDNQYVTYDKGSLGGKDGGSSQLPTNGDELYVYGFYPKGWTLEYDGGRMQNRMSHTFDGKTDLMTTYLKSGDEVKIAYATSSDKADLIFKHLLTRYNIQVKAESTEAQTAWGSVKSIKVKNDWGRHNRFVVLVSSEIVETFEDLSAPASAFYHLKGTLAAPTYNDTTFEAANFATSQALTTTFENACYTMIGSSYVDDDKTTAELILEVVTLDKDGGKESTTLVPISLKQASFPIDGSGLGVTRGYSITITLNFRTGAIQAIASVEEWKDGGQQEEDVDKTTPNTVNVGDLKDGGVVFWVDANNKKMYKVASLDEKSLDGNTDITAAPAHLLPNSENVDDGRIVLYGVKHAAKRYGKEYNTLYPASAWCDAKGTGWYQPAKNELLALYDAWKNNPAFATAMAGAGTAITAQAYQSSTWSAAASGDESLGVNFVDGTISYDPKPVRCIKSTTPAPVLVPNPGEFKDGGVILLDVTDVDTYVVMSVDQVTGKKWSESNFDLPSATNTTDGRMNVAAMKEYSKTSTSRDFATDFPAAAWCDAKNTGGVTGWYLPAYDEISDVLALHNNFKLIVDAVVTANGGTALTNGQYVSSTQLGIDNVSNQYYDLDNGTHLGNQQLRKEATTSFIRCIRRSK